MQIRITEIVLLPIGSDYSYPCNTIELTKKHLIVHAQASMTVTILLSLLVLIDTFKPSVGGFASTSSSCQHRNAASFTRQASTTKRSTKLYISSDALPPPVTDSTESKQPLPLPIVISSTPPTSPAAVFGRPLDDDTIQRNKDMVHFIKGLLFDQLFSGDSRDRAFARFYALETIARMPYFSYLSVLHLLETLGRWRRADYLKLHFCQSWNELHHLLIMEELGGSERWADRFVAQHIAFSYYWFAVALYLFNPTWAYNLNEAVESEAYETYNGFLKEHQEWLQSQPAPDVAKSYYRDGELFLFDQMHLDTRGASSSSPSSKQPKHAQRRPKCDTLYDVIMNIRDDEMEHVKTMQSLQEIA